MKREDVLTFLKEEDDLLWLSSLQKIITSKIGEVASFVNAADIKRMFGESGTAISYSKALKIKNELKDKHVAVSLPNEKVIPKAWVLEEYGEKAYKGKKKKDAST